MQTVVVLERTPPRHVTPINFLNISNTVDMQVTFATILLN